MHTIDELDKVITELLEVDELEQKTLLMNEGKKAKSTKSIKAITPIPIRRASVNRYRNLMPIVNHFDELDLDDTDFANPIVPLIASEGFKLLAWAGGELRKGDIHWRGPRGFNMVWTNKPSNLDFQTLSSQKTIINYRSVTWAGIEAVNIKLVCELIYNGPEFQARFWFKPGGNRSRLGSDTYITVNEPFSIITKPTSSAWRRFGIRKYPVIEARINFTVDEPWPNDNHHETFKLVLSGMYGFGASASDRRYIKERMVEKN